MENMKADIEKRLQLVMVLVLFFPVLLDALYKSVSDELSASHMILKWSIVIVVLVLSYLCYEGIKDRILVWVARWTNILLLLEVALFTPVFLGLALFDQTPSLLNLIAYDIGLLGVMSLPFGIFIILLINMVYLSFRSS